VRALLERLGVSWTLIGAVAAATYRASPRPTDDVDVLVHKLIAWRPRDRDDIRSILSTGLPIDDAYVGHWAREWGVGERWQDEQARG